MLVPCPRCHRHINSDAPCPFCSRGLSRGSAAACVVGGLAIVGTAILLAGCYGPPPADFCDEPDADADACQQDAPDGGADGATSQ